MILDRFMGKGKGKEKLRKNMKELRGAMTSEEVRQKSAMIAKNLKLVDDYREARAVLFYWAKGNEVQTDRVIAEADRVGKRILLPITDMKKRTLGFSEVAEYPKGLTEGAFGIMQPRKKMPFPEEEIDAVIVPGLAFSKDGYRLGYGLGFYDKLLGRLQKDRINIRRIGLAYDFQVVEKMETKKHDQRMDMIVTEKRTIRPGTAK